MDYPITATELARRLGYGGWPESGYALKQRIRPLLRELDCPKVGSGGRAAWVVDEAIAVQVAERLGRPLAPG